MYVHVVPPETAERIWRWEKLGLWQFGSYFVVEATIRLSDNNTALNKFNSVIIWKVLDVGKTFIVK